MPLPAIQNFSGLTSMHVLVCLPDTAVCLELDWYFSYGKPLCTQFTFVRPSSTCFYSNTHIANACAAPVIYLDQSGADLKANTLRPPK